MQGSATVHMAATPQQVWDLVSDVTRVGEYSPETFEAEWLDGATGPATGARFRGHVKRNEKGPVYWTTCRISDCEPGRVFEFQVVGAGKVINTWRYEFAAAGEGTDVTESFRLQPSLPMRLYWAVAGRFRGKRNNNDIRRSLERIKTLVEAPGA